MTQPHPPAYRWIKTVCGRAKYDDLAGRPGPWARLRLAWFVLIAWRKPWIGIMGWTLTSLGSPHVEFGYAAAWWPVGTVYAVATLVGLLAAKE